MDTIWNFDSLIAPVFKNKDKSLRKHLLSNKKGDICEFIGGVHAMSTSTMLKIYHLMIVHKIVDLSSSEVLKCIEFGCGIPYFATFLSWMGLSVNAIDLPDGMLILHDYPFL